MSANPRDRKRGLITQRKIDNLAQGESVAESLGYGAGTLQARGGKRGVTFAYRYGPKQTRIPIPTYNSETGKATTLAEAREQARAWSARYQAGEHDLKTALERERLERERQAEAEAAQAEAEKIKGKNTLGRLLRLYVERLEGQGKVSAKAVGQSLERNVIKPFPELCEKPAADVTPEDLLQVLERLLESGYKREAAKVRSYLRRAYAVPHEVRFSAQASKELRAMPITVNPARDLATIEGANNTRERVLSADELRGLWHHFSGSHEAGAALVRFYLLTGGQRFAQIRRATIDDISDEGLTLWDNKGKRSRPRRHVVPLLPEALEALDCMAKLPDSDSREARPRIGPYLLTLTHGKSAADYNSAKERLVQAFEALEKAGISKEPFTFGDLRRTVETRLAALGVSLETRAHLQSHGLGGLQARHYDRHDYLEEKREALERLRDLMQGNAGTVTPMRKRA